MALCKSHTMANARGSFRIAKNNRSKSVWTLLQHKRLNNQTVWPVIFGLTGPICARALKSLHPLELRPRGHHDWPVKPTIRPERKNLYCVSMTDSACLQHRTVQRAAGMLRQHNGATGAFM